MFIVVDIYIYIYIPCYLFSTYLVIIDLSGNYFSLPNLSFFK